MIDDRARARWSSPSWRGVQFGRDLWDVQLGRRDGVVSRASEAAAGIPSPSDNFTALEANFAAKGLDVKDLVILSGERCSV